MVGYTTTNNFCIENQVHNSFIKQKYRESNRTPICRRLTIPNAHILTKFSNHFALYHAKHYITKSAGSGHQLDQWLCMEFQLHSEIYKKSFSNVWTMMMIICTSYCDIVNFDINQGTPIENFVKLTLLLLKLWISIYVRIVVEPHSDFHRTKKLLLWIPTQALFALFAVVCSSKP